MCLLSLLILSSQVTHHAGPCEGPSRATLRIGSETATSSRPYPTSPKPSQRAWMANREMKDMISVVNVAAALVYCRSTFWRAIPRYWVLSRPIA